MKKTTAAAVLTAAVLLLGGCNGQTAEAEIKIPILDGKAGGSFKTAKAERHDVEEYKTIGAAVDYVYAEKLSAPFDANLLEFSVKKGTKLKEGDVIAVFDSSQFDYEYQSNKILADDAYSRYAASGNELLRLEYEQQAKRLELTQHKKDLCTIRAPYDCVVWDTEKLTTGQALTAGTPICSIAKPDEVYIKVKDDKALFSFGTPVSLKFGTASTFTGKVVSAPGASSKESVIIRLDDGELKKADEEAGSIVSAGWATVIVRDYRDYNVLCVPEKSVMTYSGETYCYIEDNGERIRVPVEAGRTVNGLTVVLNGLSDGDVVSY